MHSLDYVFFFFLNFGFIFMVELAGLFLERDGSSFLLRLV